MRPITDAIGQDLVWIERGRHGWPNFWELGTEHELRLGDDVVARLRFQMRRPSEAEVDGHRWTFERAKQERERPQGPAFGVLETLARRWRDPIAVRDEESKDIAFFFWHWSDIILEFRDGNQLRLGRWELRRSLQLEWIWEDETQEFMHFEERWHKEGQRTSRALAFQIPPTAAEFHNLPLLVVIGWYRILQYWEDARAPAG
jgi:hypothetical protein